MPKGMTKFSTKESLQKSVIKHLEHPERFETTLSPTELTAYNALETEADKTRYRLKKMESRMGNQKF